MKIFIAFYSEKINYLKKFNLLIIIKIKIYNLKIYF